MAPHKRLLGKINTAIENRIAKTLFKYADVPIGGGMGTRYGTVEPPYQRQFSPQWVYRIRRNSALINNSIEEKVNQTFRRGWGEWEKAYEAKCPACETEFGSEAEFRKQAGGHIPEDSDIDFNTERKCPECETMVEMKTPDPTEKERAMEFFDRANECGHGDDHLEPDHGPSVSQTLLEVLREASWDIESFDDEWFIFNRSYKIDKSGAIVGWELEEVHRAPPEKMRYFVDEDTGRFGSEYYVCVACRESKEGYTPQTQEGMCEICDHCDTYEAFAGATESPGGGDPVQWYIRGEFLHRSLYEPSKFYGYSPIVTLWEEARTLEKMDSWYRDAYEQRRAPRAAIAIKSSNAKSTREFNKKQFDKLQNDPNHLPTLMDDGETDGDPISFISLLESPAEMQHMEMRDWMKDRISAKWGVTPIFQGSPSDSGLSQSMEIQVSNRASDRLRTVQNGVVDVILEQLGVEGWTIDIAEVEEENEQEEAELQLKHLQIVQQAVTLGLGAEWTEDDRANVKPGEAEAPEEGGGMGMGGMDGLGEMMDDEETAADMGGPEDQADMQTATEAAGGERVDLGAAGPTGGQAPGGD